MMLLIEIFTILFSVFSIIMLGFWYARQSPTNMATANRLNVEIFGPALQFSVLSAEGFHISEYQHLAIGVVVIVLGSGLLAWPLIRWLKMSTNTLLPCIMFTNTGNMGIPVAVFALGDSALAGAVLIMVVTTAIQFSLGVYMVTHHMSWLSILKTPIMMATIAGLSVNLLDITLPALVQQPIALLGQASIPLMLFALGVRLIEIDLSHWRSGLLGAIITPLSGFMMFLLITPWLNLPPQQWAGLLIFAALPPAVFNYIIAERYQQEPHKVASIVLLGNIASLISLPIALAFALPALE